MIDCARSASRWVRGKYAEHCRYSKQKVRSSSTTIQVPGTRRTRAANNSHFATPPDHSVLPLGISPLIWDWPHRLWHWLFAAALCISLYTGLVGDISLMDLHMATGACV